MPVGVKGACTRQEVPNSCFSSQWASNAALLQKVSPARLWEFCVLSDLGRGTPGRA